MIRRIGLLAILLLLLMPIAVLAQDDTATECDEGFRLFEHESLATESLCIPENPERVATIDAFSLETLVALNTPPTSASLRFIEDLEDTFPATADRLEDTVGFAELEGILQSEPDLILSLDVISGETYDQLSEIAPTVLYEFQGSGQWKEIARFFAAAINETEGVEAIFEDYDARTEALADTPGDDVDETTVSIVRIYPDRLNLYLTESFPGTVVDDVGFPRPESQDYTADEAQEQFGNPIQYSISREELPLADGDVIFVWGFFEDDDVRDRLDSLREDPLWNSLDAVQEGEVYEVGFYWIGGGIYSAHAILDDLFTTIADVDPADAAPNPLLPEPDTMDTEVTPEATSETDD